MATVINPFFRIYESPECKKPYDFPLRNFPLLLDVEITNACNLDCLMCYRQIMTRRVGFMDKEVFQKIINEAASYKPGIRFIRYGEPLLHKDIFSFIRFVKERSLIAHMTTNGLLMDEKAIDNILASGLDSIIFSFQGAGKKEYEKIRNNNSYDTLRAAIINLKSRRDKNGLDRPFIQITTTFLDETEKERKGFIKEWQEVSDKVDYWYTSLLRLSNVKRIKPLLARQRVKEVADQGKCIEVMTKLSVNWNGDVTACCGDYDGALVLANIGKNSLKEIWDSQKLTSIRKALIEGNRNSIPFCSLCTTKFVEEQ